MNDDESRNVRSLPNEVTAGAIVPPPRPSAPSRLHGAAIAGMALGALIGTVTLLSLVTVGWTDDMRRYLVITIVGAGVFFLTCASAAVLTAARDTYPTRPDTTPEPPSESEQ
jgi:hypothetical protein